MRHQLQSPPLNTRLSASAHRFAAPYGHALHSAMIQALPLLGSWTDARWAVRFLSDASAPTAEAQDFDPPIVLSPTARSARLSSQDLEGVAAIVCVLTVNESGSAAAGAASHTLLASLVTIAPGDDPPGLIVNNAGGGGGGAGLQSGTATINFGPRDTTASVTLTGLSWVTASSLIVASIAAGTADHPSPEEPIIERIGVSVGAIVPGVGFTVHAHAPDTTHGQYAVHYLGVA